MSHVRDEIIKKNERNGKLLIRRRRIDGCRKRGLLKILLRYTSTILFKEKLIDNKVPLKR